MAFEGMELGRYRLVRLVGSGGMGEVYLAEDTRIARQVAIKIVRNEADPYPNAPAAKEAVRLFEREMKAITVLDHPNILPLIDFGEETINKASFTYMVMPFRSEGSLVDWLHQQNRADILSPQEVIHIMQQAAGALQHAHNRHLIHLDVKPSNFLVRYRDDHTHLPDVLLADFGVAKFNTATATASQSIRGTPAYMAPEQWAGSPVAATDQYALAIMTYQLLTGRSPFQGNMQQMMYQHLQERPQPPSTFNSRIPPAVDMVLLHALAKNPQERFPSIQAFASAFEQAWQREKTPVTPPLEPTQYATPAPPNRPANAAPLPPTQYGSPVPTPPPSQAKPQLSRSRLLGSLLIGVIASIPCIYLGFTGRLLIVIPLISLITGFFTGKVAKVRRMGLLVGLVTGVIYEAALVIQYGPPPDIMIYLRLLAILIGFALFNLLGTWLATLKRPH